MGLRRGDLQDTILSKLSVDEFEPKTGDLSEVVVVGFFLIQDQPAQDLYDFLNNSSLVFRDVEVSPNPNPDNYYMVFVELDREDECIEKILAMLKEVNNIAGDFDWTARAHGQDDFVDINDDSLAELIKQGPQLQPTKEPAMNDQVQEFLYHSDLSEATITTGVVTLRRGRDTVKLDLVGFGGSNRMMNEHKLTKAAIDSNFDPSLIRQLNRMLGEMRAVAVSGKIVIYNPNDESKVLITTAR
jgi:hypothetical protein